MQLVIEANDQLNKIHNWLYNKGLKINMENISINVNNIKLTNTLKLQWIINLIGRLNLKKVSKNTILCTFNLQAQKYIKYITFNEYNKSKYNIYYYIWYRNLWKQTVTGNKSINLKLDKLLKKIIDIITYKKNLQKEVEHFYKDNNLYSITYITFNN